VGARGAHHRLPVDLPRPLLVIVPAEHQIGPTFPEPSLRLPPPGESHPLGDLAAQHVVMEHDHAQRSVGDGVESVPHPRDLSRRQMPLHRRVPQVPGYRAERHPVGAQRPGDHGPGHLEHRRQIVSKVPPVLGVQGSLAEKTERARPPGRIMIAGNHEHRGVLAHLLDEHQGALVLPVPRPLAQIAGNDDGRGLEFRHLRLEAPHLVQVGVHPEVQIREVHQPD